MADQNQLQSVLDLSTDVTNRRKVRIDGQFFEIINLDEITIGERARISRFGKKFARFFEGELDANADTEEDMESTMNRIIARVLLAPNEVRTKLLGGNKLDILNAVFKPPARTE